MSTLLVEAHRRDIEELLRLALNDLDLVWREVSSADAARDALMSLLPGLTEMYGSAAATLAADWYDEMRDAAEVPGSFRAIPAELPDLGRTDALARWSVSPLYSATPSFALAKTKAAGGFQRIVADADRQTVVQSSQQDRRAKGWQRQTTGKSCEFCVMLAGRGAVYKATTVGFESHDHCDCLGVPVF